VAHALLVLLSWLASLTTNAASAQAPLEVDHGLRGVPLGTRVTLLEDATHALDVAELGQTRNAARFRASSDDAPSFGYTDSIYWVRFEVKNPSPLRSSWLLELAYPHLDDVRLYATQADGSFAERVTGDMHPFAQRDIAYRNFVFALEEPPHGARVYYLRVATTGSMNLPLVAWSMKEFIEHQHLDWSALCMFYGVVLVMVAYNALVYAFTRQREYLPYVGFILAIGVLQFTIAGHTFQFVLPSDMALVHQLLPASLAASLLFACLVVRTYIPHGDAQFRLMHVFASYFGCWAVLSFVLPYALTIRVLVVSTAVPLLNSALLARTLVRSGGKRASLFIVGWGSTIAGATVYIGQTLAFVPTTYVTTWSIQIGLSIQLVLISSALADQINSARRALKAVNGQLSTKVGALSAALARAEDATKRAQRATRVKDDFMATMSHEFRTPLNPIINIPQGMLEEFVRTRIAVCSRCSSHFELEPAETISETTPCPDCESPATLVERVITSYAGDPERARRFLEKIERSGGQLLRVVNGILDFSKLEAGHLKLVRERFDVLGLVEEVVAECNASLAVARVRIDPRSRGLCLTLEADSLRIRQVLSLLVENGLKFSSPEACVTVRIEPDADGCSFAIADEGIGIAPEHHDSIFESFEQVDKGNTRKYGGTGLGLSLSRSIVRMHGGEMWVESELARGATFHFVIPSDSLASSALSRSA